MSKRIALWVVVLALTLCGCTHTPVPTPTPAPTPTVTPAPTPTPVDPVTALLNEMTTEEKIGQLLMPAFTGGGEPVTEMTEEIAAQIAQYHLGGVALFGENLTTVEDTQALITAMQGASNIPLFIGIDEEGGAVSRLNFSDIPHEIIPAAGTIPTDEEVYRTASVMGETLVALGINLNFAPVADVNTNPSNPVIGTRAYATDGQTAAQRVTAAIQGFHSAGIATAAKHFPGHGDTTTDTHYGTATVNHDLARLQSVEFLPFVAAVEAGVDMLMVGHIGVPNVTGDDLPASLNPQIIALARGLDFDGVIITDAMNMGAIVDNFGPGQSAVMAILAGADVVLMPSDLPQAYQAIAQAVASGEITLQRLDESVTRVLQMKENMGVLSIP